MNAATAQSSTNPRAVAAAATLEVIENKRQIDAAIALHGKALDRSAAAFATALTYATIRRWQPIAEYLGAHLKKPFKHRQRRARYVLAIGLAQLDEGRTAPHAAIHETVNLARRDLAWARGIINAILRGYQRREAGRSFLEVPAAAHPGWLAEMIRKDWPEDASRIMQANLKEPPLWVRVADPASREDWRQRLPKAEDAALSPHCPTAVVVCPARPVQQLPGFDRGECSVQDGAAQWAAPLLAPAPGDRVLDACAAPGGKTLHLLQTSPAADVIALDASASRLERVRENLTRGQVDARLICADAADTASWWDGKRFARILLDAPCSALGVIRRHPEIMYHRDQQQLDDAVAQQARLLSALWPTLADGGSLLYATCSILRRENDAQIEQFIATRSDAQVTPLPTELGRPTAHGRQFLPGDPADFDGFYYALLRKSAA